MISDGRGEPVECKQPGGLRRCGGQGDVLAGAIVTFVAWARDIARKINGPSAEIPLPMLASFAACSLTRHSSKLAFDKHHRSTTTPDIINELGRAFEDMFPDMT